MVAATSDLPRWKPPAFAGGECHSRVLNVDTRGTAAPPLPSPHANGTLLGFEQHDRTIRDIKGPSFLPYGRRGEEAKVARRRAGTPQKTRRGDRPFRRQAGRIGIDATCKASLGRVEHSKSAGSSGEAGIGGATQCRRRPGSAPECAGRSENGASLAWPGHNNIAISKSREKAVSLQNVNSWRRFRRY